MSNQGKVTSAAKLNEVIFKDKAHVSVGQKFGSLFPGLGYAAAYKVRQERNPTTKRQKLNKQLSRFYKEYTNMEVNLLQEIISPYIMEIALTELLGKETAKPSCTPPLEGSSKRLHPYLGSHADERKV